MTRFNQSLGYEEWYLTMHYQAVAVQSLLPLNYNPMNRPVKLRKVPRPHLLCIIPLNHSSHTLDPSISVNRVVMQVGILLDGDFQGSRLTVMQQPIRHAYGSLPYRLIVGLTDMDPARQGYNGNCDTLGRSRTRHVVYQIQPEVHYFTTELATV